MRELAGQIPRTAIALALQHRTQHICQQHTYPRRLLPRGALGSMARRHMADLVTQHPGKFRLVIQISQDSSRDIHITARQGERIDLRAIHHREMPFQIRPLRSLGQLLPDAIHIRLQRWVIQRAVFLQYLLMRFFPLGQLGALVHYRALIFPRHRVAHRRARGQENGR